MLKWPIIFFVISVVAAILSFTGMPPQVARLAQFVLWAFVALFLVSVVGLLVRRARGQDGGRRQ